jgi:hypothetical protein
MSSYAVLFALVNVGQVQALAAAAEIGIPPACVSSGNTFEVKQMGMGEYAAHWRFTNNRFRLHPDASTTVGLAIGGLDIDFSHNDVQGGNLTGGRGFGSLIADYSGPDDYASYVGEIKIADNTISCHVSIDPAKHPGTIVSRSVRQAESAR